MISEQSERHAENGAAWRFRHFALLYQGEAGFLERVLPFVREGLDRDEPVMVATSAARCERLAAALDGGSERVEFRDMARIGRNPACIIPVWQEFADRHRDRPMRGVGEPVWAERTADELLECEHHESLLNFAFDGGPAMALLCPYDTTTLDPATIDAARRTHPLVSENGTPAASPAYLSPDLAPAPFSGPLSPVPAAAATLEFAEPSLSGARRFATGWARIESIPDQAANNLALVVHELAMNSVRHGGGSGALRLWRDGGSVVAEISDRGRIEEPLVGRRMPPARATGGRGLWIVNHLSDLVQIRSLPGGTTIRARLGAAA